MKKQYLLKKNKEYRKVYQRGPSMANRYLVVFCLPNSFTYWRLGFSIGKKIGKAFQRNRIKRRLKEICRINNQWFKSGYDYIFIARKGIENQPFIKLEESVENITYRINKKAARKVNG
ncbi:MAG TPA: ribonuclease P protein component [Desulfotomaculum sp.]|nr:MAG: ribonuclease P [Peptococcaceae bacterium BRH_c8a]KJS70966.1 MAG: ribonuclease P [Desulfotomaculum sp. BICA1-6]HBX23906.1 ribonuclease P protein component [Desulfotomaculum sp.]